MSLCGLVCIFTPVLKWQQLYNDLPKGSNNCLHRWENGFANKLVPQGASLKKDSFELMWLKERSCWDQLKIIILKLISTQMLIKFEPKCVEYDASSSLRWLSSCYSILKSEWINSSVLPFALPLFLHVSKSHQLFSIPSATETSHVPHDMTNRFSLKHTVLDFPKTMRCWYLRDHLFSLAMYILNITT